MVSVKLFFYSILIGLITISLMLLSSCERSPGEGGLATIEGTVQVEEYSPTGILLQSYPAPEERVYIVYGENEVYNDEMRTHFNGRYAFEYLNKGSYTIYAYSDCDTCASGKIPVLQTVTVTETDEVLEVPVIVIEK